MFSTSPSAHPLLLLPSASVFIALGDKTVHGNECTTLSLVASSPVVSPPSASMFIALRARIVRGEECMTMLFVIPMLNDRDLRTVEPQKSRSTT